MSFLSYSTYYQKAYAPISMGASLTFAKSVKGILIHLELSPDVLGYDELLVHIPDYHLITKTINIPDYNLITKATTFNIT